MPAVLDITYEDTTISWLAAAPVVVAILVGIWLLDRVNREAAKAVAFTLLAVLVASWGLNGVLSVLAN